MRAPLNLSGLAALDKYAAFTAEVLWLLGMITEEKAYTLRIPSGDPVQNALGVLLERGVYAHSITPLNPRRIIEQGGEQHLAEVYSALGVTSSPEEISNRAKHMQRTMTNRVVVAAKYPKYYSHAVRVGTVDDLHRALAANSIVRVQPRANNEETLVLPGADQSTCYVYSVHSHVATRSTPEWVMFYHLPALTVYSRSSLR